MSFSDLQLAPSVVRAVEERGYSEPTPVQAQAIPRILSGHDIKAIAQTGTGKTAAFALPLISMLAGGRTRARMPRCLVLCPTRELAMQVAECFDAYGLHERLKMATLIGGISFDRQLGVLERGADVLIATPGRLLDHFERGRLLLTGASLVVVDEADRMLDIGFIPDLERIFRLLPAHRQSLLFSATMPPEIEKLAKEFLSDPVQIEVTPPATTVDKVEQRLVRLPSDDDRARLNALASIVGRENRNIVNAIVFCNRKRTTGSVARFLGSRGHQAAALHGDLDQHLRMRTLDRFRSGELRILVASDVAARGLDIPTVSHVINFDVPLAPDDYVHRIGRTARAGRSGTAITLASDSEARQLARVQEILGEPSPLDKANEESAREAGRIAKPNPQPHQNRKTRTGRSNSQKLTSSRPNAHRHNSHAPKPRTAEPRESSSSHPTPRPAEPRDSRFRDTLPRQANSRLPSSRSANLREPPPRQHKPLPAEPRDSRFRDTLPRQASSRHPSSRSANLREPPPRQHKPLPAETRGSRLRVDHAGTTNQRKAGPRRSDHREPTSRLRRPRPDVQRDFLFRDECKEQANPQQRSARPAKTRYPHPRQPGARPRPAGPRESFSHEASALPSNIQQRSTRNAGHRTYDSHESDEVASKHQRRRPQKRERPPESGPFREPSWIE